jgi:transglutaminase superfamily protein
MMKYTYAMSIRSLLLLAILSLGCHSTPRIEIISETQGNFVFSNYQFIHEHWLSPKIGQLYEQEKLGDIAKAHKDEWEMEKALCNWTNAQFSPGYPEPYPLCNGVDILADIRSGKTKGFCGQYAYLFADALKAVGYYDVRYVELASRAHEFHFTTELWSDRWQKWIVLDPYFNVYYTAGSDRPLSAMELHEFAITGKNAAPEIHVLEKRDYQPAAKDSVRLYDSLATSLRNDLAGLSAPLTIGDRLRMFLFFEDPRLGAALTDAKYENRSSRIKDFEYTSNQVAIDHTPDPSRGAVLCNFSNRGTVPHFKTFLISLDGSEWTASGASYIWKLKPGENSLKLVAINMYNHFSRPAELKVRFTP